MIADRLLSFVSASTRSITVMARQPGIDPSYPWICQTV